MTESRFGAVTCLVRIDMGANPSLLPPGATLLQEAELKTKGLGRCKQVIIMAQRERTSARANEGIIHSYTHSLNRPRMHVSSFLPYHN